MQDRDRGEHCSSGRLMRDGWCDLLFGECLERWWSAWCCAGVSVGML